MVFTRPGLLALVEDKCIISALHDLQMSIFPLSCRGSTLLSPLAVNKQIELDYADADIRSIAGRYRDMLIRCACRCETS